MPDIRIVSEPHASDSLKQVVVDHLDAYNIAVTGFSQYSPVNLFLRDAGDEVVGGLLGVAMGSDEPPRFVHMT